MMPQCHSSEPYTNNTLPPPPYSRDPPVYMIIFVERNPDEQNIDDKAWRAARVAMLKRTLSLILGAIGTYIDYYFFNLDIDRDEPPKLGCRLQTLLREYRTRYSQDWMMRVVLIVCTDAEPGDSIQGDKLIRTIKKLGKKLLDSKRERLTRMGVLQNPGPLSIRFELVRTGRDISARTFLDSAGGWIGGDIIPEDLDTAQRFDYEGWLENVAVGAIYLRVWETLDV